MSRMDYSDSVELVSVAFFHLKALSLPRQEVGTERPLDLGNLRAGGATHILMLTEDSELVRRRGRWLAYQTMQIYLQEPMAFLIC